MYVFGKHVHGLIALIYNILESDFATVYVFDEKF